MAVPARHRHGRRLLSTLAVGAVVVLVAGCSSTTRSSSAGGSGKKAPGVTANAIYIGVPHLAAAVNAGGVGAKGVTIADAKVAAQAVIDDINSHGGVAGRKLVPVFQPYRATDSQQALDQAQCAAFTRDHHVFAALAASRPTPSYLQCLSKSGVVLLDDQLVQTGAATFRKFPNWVNVNGWDLDRVAAVQPPALKDQNYFTPWNVATGAPGGSATKVGIITFDDTAFAHAVDKVLIPGLAKAGQGKPEVVRVSAPQTDAQVGGLTAALQSAVLRFRSHHVDHVIIFETGGVLTLFFTKAAESQHYRPRYAASTNNGSQALIDGAGLPKAQFEGAVGFGFSPLLDLPYSQNTLDGPYSNAMRRHCHTLATADGQQFTDANGEATATTPCNELYLLRDALKTQGKTVSADSIFAGLNALGSKFEASGSLGTRFSSSRHDGGSGYRYWAYQDSCGCFGYTGPLRHAK
jgi:hypothetical protein